MKWLIFMKFIVNIMSLEAVIFVVLNYLPSKSINMAPVQIYEVGESLITLNSPEFCMVIHIWKIYTSCSRWLHAIYRYFLFDGKTNNPLQHRTKHLVQFFQHTIQIVCDHSITFHIPYKISMNVYIVNIFRNLLCQILSLTIH